MKKALIFDPYLDTLGGGELYFVLIAEFFIRKGYELEIAWPDKEILSKIYQRFGLKLDNKVKINTKAFYILKGQKNLFQKYLLTKNYQLVFFLSDGSIPFLFAKKNFVHFQTPFINIANKSFANQLKLKKITIICNSMFTKKYIDKEFNVDSLVVYPPLQKKFSEMKAKEKKDNIILSVGRFDQIMNAKKQDVLINVFRQMINNGLKNWKLVLLGGLMQENKYFNRLKQSATGYPIIIIANADFKTLVDYYQNAKIYWHAAGFGEDLNRHPERAEHFGISIIEAMSCGVVPVVFNAGGIPEVLGKASQKLLWNSLEELVQKTEFLIKDSELWKKTSRQVKKRALFFNKTNFFEKLSNFLS